MDANIIILQTIFPSAADDGDLETILDLYNNDLKQAIEYLEGSGYVADLHAKNAALGTNDRTSFTSETMTASSKLNALQSAFPNIDADFLKGTLEAFDGDYDKALQYVSQKKSIMITAVAPSTATPTPKAVSTAQSQKNEPNQVQSEANSSRPASSIQGKPAPKSNAGAPPPLPPRKDNAVKTTTAASASQPNPPPLPSRSSVSRPSTATQSQEKQSSTKSLFSSILSPKTKKDSSTVDTIRFSGLNASDPWASVSPSAPAPATIIKQQATKQTAVTPVQVQDSMLDWNPFASESTAGPKQRTGASSSETRPSDPVEHPKETVINSSQNNPSLDWNPFTQEEPAPSSKPIVPEAARVEALTINCAHSPSKNSVDWNPFAQEATPPQSTNQQKPIPALVHSKESAHGNPFASSNEPVYAPDTASTNPPIQKKPSIIRHESLGWNPFAEPEPQPQEGLRNYSVEQSKPVSSSRMPKPLVHEPISQNPFLEEDANIPKPQKNSQFRADSVSTNPFADSWDTNPFMSQSDEK